MAVRFINPVESEYKSQFVPLPLDFIYGNIQAKQKDLDTARQKVAATEVNVKGTPWWEQGKTNYVKLKQEEYNNKIAAIANKLEMNKEAPQTALSDISKLNREFQEDEIVQTMLRQNKLWEPIAKKAAEDPNAAASFWLDLKKFDPTKKDWVWNDPFSIKDEMIKAPTFAETDKYITDNFGKFLQPQIEERYGGGATLTYIPELGRYQIVGPSGKLIEAITDSDLVNNIIPTAIDNYADYLANTDQHAQARVIREGLSYGADPTPYYGRDVSKHRNLISSVVSKHFRIKDIQQKPDIQYIEPATPTTKGGATTTTPKVEDIRFSIEQPSPINFSEQYSTIGLSTSNLERDVNARNNILFNNTINDIVKVSPNSQAASQAIIKMDEALNETIKALEQNLWKQGDDVFASQEDKDALQKIVSDPAIGFKSLFANADASDQSIATLKNQLGQKGFDNFRAKVYNVMSELAASPDPESQAIAENFYKTYASLEYDQSILAQQKEMVNSVGAAYVDQAISSGIITPEEVKAAGPLLQSGTPGNEDFKRLVGMALGGDPMALKQLEKPGVWDRITSGSITDYDLGAEYAADDKQKGISGPSAQGYAISWKSYAPLYEKIKNNLDKLNASVKQEEYIVEFGDEKSELTKYTNGKNGLKDQYNANPAMLMQVLQGYGKSLLGEDQRGKTEFNQNDLRLMFNKSPLKMPNFNLADADKVEVSTVNLGKLGNSSMPTLYITAKDSKGNSSTLPVAFNQINKSVLANMVTEFMTDNDPQVKAYGAELYGRATMSDGELANIGTMFDLMNRTKDVKDQTIKFTAGGAPYELKVENGTAVIGINANGKFQSLGQTETPAGIQVPNNVTNMDEFLEFMGFYTLYNNLYTGQLSSTGAGISTTPITIGGGPGGTTTPVGKSQGSPIPVGQLWTRQ